MLGGSSPQHHSSLSPSWLAAANLLLAKEIFTKKIFTKEIFYWENLIKETLAKKMLDKDVEAEGATNMCGDNLIVCGALAEGLVVFIFILVVCLVVGFSAY